MVFKPGQSGLPGGRNNPRNRMLTDALIVRLLHEEGVEAGPKQLRTNLQVIVEKLVDMARNGDAYAIKECWDRVEGKALQTLDVTKVSELDDITLERLQRLASVLDRRVIENEEAGRAKDAGVQARALPTVSEAEIIP